MLSASKHHCGGGPTCPCHTGHSLRVGARWHGALEATGPVPASVTCAKPSPSVGAPRNARRQTAVAANPFSAPQSSTWRTRMRRVVETLLTLAFTATITAAAWAQATIAGEVRDTSGGVLPGVAVEAASPALIEKVRTATTDSNGRYRIEDLRPGTYTVAFTLPGFATTRREQLMVSGTGVIAVDAEMRVG